MMNSRQSRLGGFLKDFCFWMFTLTYLTWTDFYWVGPWNLSNLVDLILIRISRLGTFMKYRNHRPGTIPTLVDTCLGKCRLLVGHIINSVRGREHPAGAIFLQKNRPQDFWDMLQVRKVRFGMFLGSLLEQQYFRAPPSVGVFVDSWFSHFAVSYKTKTKHKEQHNKQLLVWFVRCNSVVSPPFQYTVTCFSLTRLCLKGSYSVS